VVTGGRVGWYWWVWASAGRAGVWWGGGFGFDEDPVGVFVGQVPPQVFQALARVL
jgi:hypothetical protein